MTFRLEHREDRDYEWTAIVFADAFVCAIAVDDPYRQGRTDALRVYQAPEERRLWWIKLDRAGTVVAHIPDDTVYGPIDPAILERIRQHGPAIVKAAAPLFEDVEHPVYIRFGTLPRGGRSRNHATGALESGVSCYRARRRVDGGYVLTGPGLGFAAIAAAAGMYDAALLITGEECGRGSDGEPLLRRVRTLARLRYDNGKFVEVTP